MSVTAYRTLIRTEMGGRVFVSHHPENWYRNGVRIHFRSFPQAADFPKELLPDSCGTYTGTDTGCPANSARTCLIRVGEGSYFRPISKSPRIERLRKKNDRLFALTEHIS